MPLPLRRRNFCWLCRGCCWRSTFPPPAAPPSVPVAVDLLSRGPALLFRLAVTQEQSSTTHPPPAPVPPLGPSQLLRENNSAPSEPRAAAFSCNPPVARAGTHSRRGNRMMSAAHRWQGYRSSRRASLGLPFSLLDFLADPLLIEHLALVEPVFLLLPPSWDGRVGADCRA